MGLKLKGIKTMENVAVIIRLAIVVAFLSFGANLLIGHGQDIAASLETSAALFILKGK